MPVLIDCNQVFISSVMAQMAMDKQIKPDVNVLRHMVLSSILFFKSKFGEEFGELVFCDDGWRYWRKDIFPYYKSHRSKSRDDSKHDWTLIFEALKIIKNELIEHFPYKFIRIEDAEADDVIACISKFEAESLPQRSVLILSNDRDFVQLQKYSNVKQYSLREKRFIGVDCAKDYLFEKVLRGDSGDGIPNFLSDNDALANPDKKQTRLYTKKIEEWKHNPKIDIITGGDKVLRKNIARNARLIDFSFIPEEVETKIINEYTSQNPTKKDFMKYFIKNNLKLLLREANKF